MILMIYNEYQLKYGVIHKIVILADHNRFMKCMAPFSYAFRNTNLVTIKYKVNHYSWQIAMKHM